MKTQKMKKLSVSSYQLSVKSHQSLLMAALFILLSVSSCKKDDDDDASGKYSSGVFVTNEGPFGTGTGTVSFISRDSNTIENDIFEAVNGRPLGNVVQSITVINDKAYIVVNNADKIEIVTADDFKEAGTIAGLKLPRYILPVGNNKAYVSQWGTTTGEIKVIDLSTNAVTKTITAGKGADKMLLKGNHVFVVNNGAFDVDSSVSVIDITTDSVVHTIHTATRPSSIVEDASGKIWVLCEGIPFYLSPAVTEGILHRINPSDFSIETSFTVDYSATNPMSLFTDNNKQNFYFSMDGGLFKMNLSNGSFTSFIDRNFYATAVDPVNGLLYAGDAGTFSSNGKVLRYNSSTGAVVDSFEAGLAPNGFFFR